MQNNALKHYVFLWGVCAVHSCCVFINHSCVKSTSHVHIKYSYIPLPLIHSFTPVCVVLHVCSVVTLRSHYHILSACVYLCVRPTPSVGAAAG